MDEDSGMGCSVDWHADVRRCLCCHVWSVTVADSLANRTSLPDGVFHACGIATSVTRGALSGHLMCMVLSCYIAPRYHAGRSHRPVTSLPMPYGWSEHVMRHVCLAFNTD